MEPSFVLQAVMNDIQKKKGDSFNFQVPSNRASSEDRQVFLRNFVEAQMVVYETHDENEAVGVSRGWFFWTLKMEFAVFAEWDFLRGYREGWIPKLPSPSESAQSVFGTCREIAAKTKDDATLVTEYPNPKTTPDLWSGLPADDDFVVSHADSITVNEKSTGEKTKPTPTSPKEEPSKSQQSNQQDTPVSKNDVQTKTIHAHDDDDEKSKADTTYQNPTKNGIRAWFPAFCVVFFAWGIWKVFLNEGNVVRNRRQYTNLDAPTQLSV
jgi:hypothetical protein